MLHSHKERYNQSDSRVCPMCNIGSEDAVHFILYCNHSNKNEYYKRKSFDCMSSPEIDKSILAEGDEYFIKLILNTELVGTK